MYTLRGHKWFTSAPMCDVFLVLAQAPDGLSCFLVPRVLPDGSRNTFRIQRLKDKLGNRSNASSEPEFDGTVAWLVGPEGRGVKTIIEMVNCTRLDCVMMSATLMRKTLVEAGHHARYRSAFGTRLLEQPLMRNVLADLALESEAATTLTLRLAGAADRSVRGDDAESAFRRIATAVGKFWVTKRGPAFTAEALECLGGNGYVEDSGMPRHYREAPLLSIWEGSGNVNALDVLRALTREPGTAEALFAELALAQGTDARLDASVNRLKNELNQATETSARRLVEHMALTLQASLLVRHAPAAVADAFCATRLAGDWGHSFGTLRLRRPRHDPRPRSAHRRMTLGHPRFRFVVSGVVQTRDQSGTSSGEGNVFTGIDEVGWASLHHAYGSAEDVPGLLGDWPPRTPSSGRPRSTGCTTRCTTRGSSTTRRWPASRSCSRSRAANRSRTGASWWSC